MSSKIFMRRALELAALGRGRVSPNPLVGCVIVHDGKIIGEGYHERYGEAHAEVNAVNSVQNPELLPESTVYVTLEPCAHFGKTPPCADLLVDKKVKKVVIASRDPFDQVDGKGMEKLQRGGVKVAFGMLEKEAIELNRRFFKFHQRKQPYVILKWAETADGFVARSNYDSKWISDVYSRQLVHKLRAEEDAILVGKNTALYDNPTLNVREWTGRNPTRILLDSNLETPPTHNLLDGSIKTLIINQKKSDTQGNSQWVQVEAMTPQSILEELHRQRIQSVIIEGGSGVLNSFIQENCWDEARVFKADVKFHEGISAPAIKHAAASRSTIQNDQLIIYHNHG